MSYTEELYDSKKHKTFEQEMMDVGRVPNIITGILCIIFICFTSGLTSLVKGVEGELPLRETVIFIGTLVFLMLALEYIIAPVTNHFITRNISALLQENAVKPLEELERTLLVKKLMRCPVKISIQVALVFSFEMAIAITLLYYVFEVRLSSVRFIGCTCFFGSYISAIVSFSYAERLCSEKAAKLVEKGMDHKTVNNEEYFGISLKLRIVLAIILPYFFSYSISFIYYVFAMTRQVQRAALFTNLTVLVILSTSISIVISFFVFYQFSGSFKIINKMLEKFTSGDFTNNNALPVDLKNEISYNIYLVNNIINYVKQIANDAEVTSIYILNSTSELLNSSNETVENSTVELNSIKDCIEKMERATDLLGKITDRTADVRFTAENTKENVKESNQLLTANLVKMEEITNANLDTIAGIKNLSKKIEDIWEIITKVDAIAEKTIIIAFNAELEATSAGEQGEKFHIIANEIRRLASTISDSTKEIKERITAIQHSSDNLIITSEGSTQKIREGSEFFVSLNEQFNELHLSSDITAESATEIQDSTNNQDNSFIEIDKTLREISKGFENFSNYAKQIMSAAEKIKTAAILLNKNEGDE
ncbi:MAG: methyl-accepting chemotaxis protein [Treponema sp.]|nr:methyl-accepting chemotaxis protein [Spirochaetia bacterium]MDY4902898.1 methyl-accepting chemotaxis protein [Treponema sp.]